MAAPSSASSPLPVANRDQAQRNDLGELRRLLLAVADQPVFELEMQRAGIAAGRLAIDVSLLDQEHPGAGTRQVIRGSAAHEAAAEHHDVVPCHCRLIPGIRGIVGRRFGLLRTDARMPAQCAAADSSPMRSPSKFVAPDCNDRAASR